MTAPNLAREPRSLLVTGGSGFIGSSFIRYLLGPAKFQGRILNLDLLTYAGNPENLAGVAEHERYRFERGDILDAALVARLVAEHGVDTIVHFAAESHVDRSIVTPGAFIQTNVVGTFQLLEVARKATGVHFHHVSTDEVFGSLGPTGAFREDTPYSPNSPYSASKAGSDHLVRAYHHTYGLSVTLSNCSNNYGPYQFPEKLIPVMILNLAEGKPLPVYGDGLNVRDWLYVDDHAEAIWRIVRSGRAGETYNVGGEGERTNLEIIRLLIENVAAQTGKAKAELERQITFVKDRPGHDRRYAIDFGKVKSELGWSPAHDLARGLADTVRWYLDNSGWIERVRTGAYREWMATNYEQR
ncbi:MAG TPA: dTDP-glucose 4,6-dehydratase [Polyangiaceae bacterium]|jgi:dTDP-glucose 4,6-dehydratase|nr:dTDP-glucose 4,6-dehydratase [Polyangiaceae bacterium]